MSPIDHISNNPIHHLPIEKTPEAPPQQQQIQNPQDPTVQGGGGGGGHGKVGHVQSPTVQQAPAAVSGHEKSWKSHFAHMQNPASVVVKKHVKAEMKRISKEEKKVQDKKIAKRDKEGSSQGQGQDSTDEENKKE